MGAQWKHAGRLQNSSKRSALVGKLVKEIIVAAKMGDPSPENNARLRAGVEAAKKQSVPRDTIERAIKKGAGLLDDPVQFETISYEGFAPHRVPVIVECLTDNKNRTAADVRVLFRKGQLGSQGAVAWMFDRLGVVEATMGQAGVDIEGAAIEAGAQNVEPLEVEEVLAGQTGARFFADPTDLDSVSKALVQAGWTVTLAELSYVPKSIVELAEAEKKEAIEFLQALDDHDDVHRVYTALK
ncbi:YebC/PmpR family DNA-binding transcriptional regulator [bacterium]|nr:YebC/PmpR family DNA-binding transcriptional regulator [bacterium]